MYRILDRKDIDTKSWDHCVSRSPHSNVFGKSWFLDIACDRWRGLVRGDYEAVFPLIESSKFGMKYLYQPAGLASVSWYSPETESPEDFNKLFSAVRSHYAFADMNIRSSILSDDFDDSESIRLRNYQFLELENRSYSEVEEHFSAGHRNLIRKARKSGIEVSKNTDVLTLTDVALKSTAAEKIPRFHRQFRAIEKLIRCATEKSRAQIWTAMSAGEPVSSTLIIREDDILYLNFIFATPEGLNLNANKLLIAEVIRENMPNLRGFDFCGSNISSIADFNKRFGAANRTSFSIKSGRFADIIGRLRL